MSNIINYSTVFSQQYNKAIVFDLLSCHFFENAKQENKYIIVDSWEDNVNNWIVANNLTTYMLEEDFMLQGDVSYLPAIISQKINLITLFDKNNERLGTSYNYFNSDINLLYFFKRLSEVGKVNIEKIKLFFTDTIKDQIFTSFLRLTYLTPQQRVEYQDYNLAEFIDVKNYDDNIIEFKKPLEIKNHSILTLNTVSNIPSGQTINYEIVYNY